MGAGDTIPGQVRVHGLFNDGSEPRLLGPLSQDRIDYVNNSVDAEEKLYVNTAISQRRSKPAGAQSVTEPRLKFGPGETLRLKHLANSLSEAIDYDLGDAFEIEVVMYDQVRDQHYERTLTVNDTAISTNPTSDTSDYVTFFEFTVPENQEMVVAGSFGAIAAEAA